MSPFNYCFSYSISSFWTKALSYKIYTIFMWVLQSNGSQSRFKSSFSLFVLSKGGLPSNLYPSTFSTLVTDCFDKGFVAENKNSHWWVWTYGCLFYERV